MTTELYPRERPGLVRDAAAEAGLGAVLLTPGPDLRYVIGYDAKELERLTCLVVPAEGEPFLVVPRLELPAAQASPDRLPRARAGPLGRDRRPYGLVAAPAAAGVAHGRGRRPDVGAMALRFRAAMPDAEQVSAGSVLRGAADAQERRRGRGAAQRRARRSTGSTPRPASGCEPGRTEREVGRDIAEAILAEGHARVDFVIVGSGPNGASPHHELVRPGDPAPASRWSSTSAGRCRAATARTPPATTAWASRPPSTATYYAVLEEAQRAAREAVRPGVAPEAVDAAARDVITAAGYGEHFFHRTGHGIGLETHEEPYIVAGNREPLEPGMAFSSRAGHLPPGRHGARIEDIVVCTEDGHEAVNATERGLVVIE